MEDRRRPVERRTLVDLTRSERGEPERRAVPGLERRDLEHRDPPAPAGDAAEPAGPGADAAG